VLFYYLMKGLQINVGSILRQNMLKFRNNKRWHFCYDSLLTWFLRSLGVEKEVYDIFPPCSSHLVDVTKNKAQDTSHVPILLIVDRQDDSWMGHMFGMAKLQLWIGGRSTTEEEMTTLV